MVVRIADEYIRGVTDLALIRRVVLTSARNPRPGWIVNMDFTRRVMKAEEATREDGNRVAPIRDTRNREGGTCIDVGRECLSPNLR